MDCDKFLESIKAMFGGEPDYEAIISHCRSLASNCQLTVKVELTITIDEKKRQELYESTFGTVDFDSIKNRAREMKRKFQTA